MKSVKREFTAGFLFCGLGAGAMGFLGARAKFGEVEGRFRNLGGVDNDPLACADFETLTGGRATCADVSTMTIDAIRSAWGDEAPDCVFTSPPCKGFSRLLPTKTSKTDKYQNLNLLVLQGINLVCSAWDRPPSLLVLENVPGIRTRGAELLTKVRSLLTGYGYAISEEIHDCGEIGGLAQHRRRFLLVARQRAQVPNFVYRPPRLRVKGCGEVLGELPLPEAPDAGPLHRLPRLSWLNWVRLSLIPAGGDWRDLPTAGQLARAIAARDRGGALGVVDWEEPTGVVTGTMLPAQGSTPANVADPRLPANDGRHEQKYRVTPWDKPVHTVTAGDSRIGSGAPNVADPRLGIEKMEASAADWKGRPGYLGVQDWNEPTQTITGRMVPGTGSAIGAVADPRIAMGDPRLPNELTTPLEEGQPRRELLARHGVQDWTEPVGTIAGPGSNGTNNVADPRLEDIPLRRPARNGAWGVMDWRDAAACVTGQASIDNGRVAVADPRGEQAGLYPIIISEDGTWHRPLTTLELAALQGIPSRVKGKPLVLAGRSNAGWRERIGNAVPRGAGMAIAASLLVALIAPIGHFILSNEGVWVRPSDGWTEDPMEFHRQFVECLDGVQ